MTLRCAERRCTGCVARHKLLHPLARPRRSPMNGSRVPSDDPWGEPRISEGGLAALVASSPCKPAAVPILLTGPPKQAKACSSRLTGTHRPASNCKSHLRRRATPFDSSRPAPCSAQPPWIEPVRADEKHIAIVTGSARVSRWDSGGARPPLAPA
ncbi:uncharacterized protein M421DRAFT_255510 [Didymella exigua CBS 183.55]|uniref:Uncharacterized protein n=1 Tax=Didymella exigua CBS 183.55 TaxID=1150837 RepID=A0A6A5S0Q1_9PLEO|nr:uncharacterized protein M421DRAFT_255510 [Didymella exigua CBS 183.55]KAF1933044.1 hypothetical protein M421DRAFT_255510 [Didymella exigua CBS 183.55]